MNSRNVWLSILAICLACASAHAIDIMGKVTKRELVTTDDQGHTFRAKRIPDEQAAKEKASW